MTVLVLSACSRSGTGSDNDGQSDGSGAGDGSGAATSAPTSAATGAPSAAAATPAGADLTELQKKRKAATFKVAYEWSGTGSTPTSETWYHKGTDSRVDWGEPGQPSYASHYINKDGAFLCSVSGSETTCFKTQTAAENPEELSFAATIMTAYEGVLTDPSFSSTRESRTIAGQSAACWKSGALLMLGLAEVTLCYDAGSGVPLLFEWKAGNDTFQMTAKTYSSTVADSDFVLPAKPISY